MTSNGPEQGSRIGRRRAAGAAGTNPSYHDRRSEIVEAAVALFRKQGFRETTLAHVAAAVGMDRATMYYYFGSKEEVLNEAVTPIVARDTEAAEAIRESTDPAPVKLRQIVTRMMRSYAEHYPILYVYIQEHLSHVAEPREAWATEMRSLNRRYEAAVEAIIQEGVESGSLRHLARPRTLAFGIMGMVGWTYRWYDPEQSPEGAAEIGDAYADLILRGITGDSEKPS